MSCGTSLHFFLGRSLGLDNNDFRVVVVVFFLFFFVFLLFSLHAVLQLEEGPSKTKGRGYPDRKRTGAAL
jgi:hypothetical protein